MLEIPGNGVKKPLEIPWEGLKKNNGCGVRIEIGIAHYNFGDGLLNDRFQNQGRRKIDNWGRGGCEHEYMNIAPPIIDLPVPLILETITQLSFSNPSPKL